MHPLLEQEYAVFDLETDGVDKRVCNPLEVGLVRITGSGKVKKGYETYIQVHSPIPPDVSGIHHITNADIEKGPNIAAGLAGEIFEVFREEAPLVAYNAPFDFTIAERCFGVQAMAGDLCALKLARKCILHAPDYKLSTLRYLMQIDIDQPREKRIAHGALADAQITAKLLAEMIQYLVKGEFVTDLASLATFCWAPQFVERCPFPKHKGKLNRDIPTDYIQWILENIKELDADIHHTYVTVLQERGLG